MAQPPNHVHFLFHYIIITITILFSKCDQVNFDSWWLSLKYIISCVFCSKDFALYAEICFQKFGDRVKNWITFNEPHTFSIQGYDVGLQAPGRCSIILGLFCKAGNSAVEPYVVGHNVLLSHAAAVDIYRRKYQVGAYQ